jgi:hypothetical protein
MSFGYSFALACGAGLLLSLTAGAKAEDKMAFDGNWSCECLTFDGSSENCHMFASAKEGVFSFGAFETSGEGTFSVERSVDEAVVTGQIRTVTGHDMTVIIVQPAGGGDAQVFTDERSEDGAPFTAACTSD